MQERVESKRSLFRSSLNYTVNKPTSVLVHSTILVESMFIWVVEAWIASIMLYTRMMSLIEHYQSQMSLVYSLWLKTLTRKKNQQLT